MSLTFSFVDILTLREGHVIAFAGSAQITLDIAESLAMADTTQASLIVVLTENLADTNSATWNDFVVMALLPLTDSINNWADVFTSRLLVVLTENPADSLTLADAFSSMLPAVLTKNLSDNLNNWTDSAKVVGPVAISLSDNSNNWAELFASNFKNFSDTLNNWEDSIALSFPLPAVSSSALTFHIMSPGVTPTPQVVSVSNFYSGPLTFSITTDASWLTASPVSAVAPQDIQISINSIGLSPGTYTGHVFVFGSGPAVITVTFMIGPGDVVIQAGGNTIGVISASGTGETSFLDVLYRYANLTLPYNPQDPGLSYSYDNSSLAADVLLNARFFNLLNEPSTPLVVNAGTSGLGECLDPRNFGAVGDGIANDTAAVQAAFNKARDNAAPMISGGFPIGPTTVCIPTGETCLVGGWIDICAPPFDNINHDPRSEEFPFQRMEAIAMYPNTQLSVDGQLSLITPASVSGMVVSGMQCPQLAKILLGGPYLDAVPAPFVRLSATHDIRIFGTGIIDGGRPEPRFPIAGYDTTAFWFDGLYNCVIEDLTIQNFDSMFTLTSDYASGGNLTFTNLRCINAGQFVSINGYVSPTTMHPTTTSGFLTLLPTLDSDVAIDNCLVVTDALGGDGEFDTILLRNYRNIRISNNTFAMENFSNGFPIGMSPNTTFGGSGTTIGLSQLIVSNNAFLNFYTAIAFSAAGAYQGVSITDNVFTQTSPTIFGECITLAGEVMDGLSIAGNNFSGYSIAVFGDAITS